MKPEEMICHTDYAFSYNPEEQPIVQGFGKVTLTTFSSWADTIYEMFDRCKYCKIRTTLEISRHGRLHMHGTIQIINLIKFFFFDIKILRFHGSYEIDTIKDPLKWEIYCTKQSDDMIVFCENYDMSINYPVIR